ncbi:MAG: AAA family ATPase, partial [Acidobacteria bacterium]|nr:AAA family ATPase [Acidobacteriota bacterium]
ARRGRSLQDVRFLSFDPASMRTAWNAVVTDRREPEVVEALRILMPEIDSVQFLAGRRRHNVLVGQRDVRPRLPIGSYGDGMRRLLAVSLALVATRNGCLLIDEIDTGLHWTVMEDMWRLVVEGAQRSNVQVFATTHSYDCIKGLGQLVRSRPDLADSVAVQKVHRKLAQAVRIAGDEIPIAVEQDIEVR